MKFLWKRIYYWDIIGTSMNFQKRFQSANSHQFTNICDFVSIFVTSWSTSFLLHTCLISGRRAGSPLFCSPRKVSKRRVASTMLRPSGEAVVIVASTKQFKTDRGGVLTPRSYPTDQRGWANWAFHIISLGISLGATWWNMVNINEIYQLFAFWVTIEDQIHGANLRQSSHRGA